MGLPAAISGLISIRSRQDMTPLLYPRWLAEGAEDQPPAVAEPAGHPAEIGEVLVLTGMEGIDGDALEGSGRQAVPSQAPPAEGPVGLQGFLFWAVIRRRSEVSEDARGSRAVR